MSRIMQGGNPQKTQGASKGRNSSYYDDLRSRVITLLTNDLEPGGRVPSDRQLSQQLGISNVTLVRLMHDLQREGWVQRVPGKGTFLNPSPEFNVSNDVVEDVDWGSALPPVEVQVKAHTAVIAPLGVRPEQARQLQNREPVTVSRIERTIQQAGGQTTVINWETTRDDEIYSMVGKLRESGANSLVLVGTMGQHQNELWLPALQEWQEDTAVPVVNMSIHEPARLPWCDTVSFDSGWGAYLLGRHLRELGHSSVVYAVPEVVANKEFVVERFASLQRAWLTAQPKAHIELLVVPVPEDVNVVVDLLDFPPDGRDYWRACGEVAAEMLLDDECSAIVLANDKMAQYFIEKSYALGRNSLENLSVAGYDDRYNSSALGLTTIHPPIENMADCAARLALRRLQSPTFEGWMNLVLKPHLIVRSSTKRLVPG